MHLVQISNDSSILALGVDAEPVRRQIAYQAALERQHPGARTTILVFGRSLPTQSRHLGGLTIRAIEGGTLRWPLVWFALERLHRADPIQVVTTQKVYGEAWFALLFRLTHKVPIVGQIHFDIFSPEALGDAFGRGLRGRAMWNLMARALRRFDRIRVVGERTGAEIVRRGLHRREAIYNLPVPVPILGTDPKPSDLPEPRVLFVGRLVEQKNLELWLSVAQAVAGSVPEARFDIVGDGPLRSRLEARALALGIGDRVTFHGAVPYERLDSFYSNARVFLLTSHYEGFGRVLVEAYAHGVPCVASVNPGVEDIVGHGTTGFLHETRDAAGFAGSTCRLLLDPTLARAMGRAGREVVARKYDPRELVARNVAELLATARPDNPFRPPRRRTWKRWLLHWKQNHSLLRSLQYEVIRGIELTGRQLDLGGGAKAGYLPLLRVHGTLESANIDAGMRPTHLLNLREKLPFDDASFDGFVSFNTFEHLPDDGFALREAIRILRPGGTFHVLVPFCYRLHAAPWDFNRRTPYWWIETLATLGIGPRDHVIEPLVWSRFTSGLALVENTGSRWSRALRKTAMLFPVIRDWLPWRRADCNGCVPDIPSNRIESDFAVGFYVRGRKPS